MKKILFNNKKKFIECFYKTRLCTGFFLVGFLTVINGCYFQYNNNVIDNDVLIVGTNTGYAPYEFIDDLGKLSGFDIDLAMLLGKELGKKIIFKDLAFDGLIVSLMQKKIDLIIAGMSITPSRQEQIALIHYQGDPLTYIPFVFWQKIPKAFAVSKKLQDLTGSTIAVQSGNLQEEILSKEPCLTIKHLESISDLIMEIKYEKSIACTLEPAIFDRLKQQHPELIQVLVPLPCELKNFGNGIGVNRDNTLLINDVTKSIAKLKANGMLDELITKWFSKEGV